MPLVPLAPFKTPRRAAAAQVAKAGILPAPVGGLNYRDPISAMSPTDALVLDNFIPKQTGVELRKGWQYHTTAVPDPIVSIFTYNAPNPANSKVFAAAGGEIYDVTSSTPSVSQTATGSNDDLWVTTQFSNGADTFLLAVSPGAGYWTYDTANGWVQQTVTGLPADPSSVMVWKNRVWFTVEGESNVYYLDTVDAIAGTASAFEMGSLLRNGGYVRALVNWTLDAGVGIDDYLIVIGSEGDVGVWQGTDPTDANKFGLKGVWYVGPVPKYGKFYTSYGGDVMVVSELGLVPVSRLINGQFSETQPGPSQKIQSVLSPLISRLRTNKSWDVFVAPANDVLVISLPVDAGSYVQFAMNVNTGAWCTFSNMPINCGALLNGELYFGIEDGRVAKGLTGRLDAVAVNGTGGTPVEGDVQTAFNAFGSPGLLKKFSMARPIFLSKGPPSVKLQINTQYSFTNVGGSPSFTQQAEGVWDLSYWNQTYWAGSSASFQAWVGTTGLGYYAALRMKVRGEPGTIFTSSHMLYETGGLM